MYWIISLCFQLSVNIHSEPEKNRDILFLTITSLLDNTGDKGGMKVDSGE